MTSSSSSSLGCIASALASSSRLRSGPPSASARWSAWAPSPMKSSSSRACSRAADAARAAPRPEQRADRDIVEHGQAGERLDDLKGAGDAETGAAKRRQVIDAPTLEAELALIGGELPLIRLTSVVLPAPLGPISPRISPAAREKLTWSTEVSPWKRLVRFRASKKRNGALNSPVTKSLSDHPISGAITTTSMAIWPSTVAINTSASVSSV